MYTEDFDLSYDLTIVVPTHNRRDLLRDGVASLRRQSFPVDRYEIVAVSDGSTDGTDEEYATPLASPATRLVRQEKRGLSAARNLGLHHAQGRLVMFVDDDMVADEKLAEMHVDAHARFDEHVAVRGRVKPASDLPDTAFCRIVIGDICGVYEAHADRARFVTFERALSWQTSFKKSELERLGGYDETFRLYGWEDIEFAYRASQQGLRFYYEPRAISLHRDQRNTLPTHGQRLRNASRMAPFMFARHPEIRATIPMYADKEPIDWKHDHPRLIAKKAARQLLATRPLMQFLEGVTPLVERATTSEKFLRRWYYGLLGSYVLLGYREGLTGASGSGHSEMRPSRSSA